MTLSISLILNLQIFMQCSIPLLASIGGTYIFKSCVYIFDDYVSVIVAYPQLQ